MENAERQKPAKIEFVSAGSELPEPEPRTRASVWLGIFDRLIELPPGEWFQIRTYTKSGATQAVNHLMKEVAAGDIEGAKSGDEPQTIEYSGALISVERRKVGRNSAVYVAHN